MTHQRYTHNEIHEALIVETRYRGHVPPERQAYACPYYDPLSGILGSDWGVCLNPDAKRFGCVIFEHDDCGCIGPCPRGNQRRGEWIRRGRD